MLQCVAVALHSGLQCVAVRCSALQCVIYSNHGPCHHFCLSRLDVCVCVCVCVCVRVSLCSTPTMYPPPSFCLLPSPFLSCGLPRVRETERSFSTYMCIYIYINMCVYVSVNIRAQGSGNCVTISWGTYMYTCTETKRELSTWRTNIR